VLGNNCLRKGEVTDGLGKLHIEEIQDFNSSQNIIRLIKSRRWVYKARMGESRVRVKLWIKNLKETNILWYLGTDGSIIHVMCSQKNSSTALLSVLIIIIIIIIITKILYHKS
jgi:hypothetical protein